ncbi:site-specific integrase [Demequina sp. SYSU T00068]|uniref:tyrosine-type recombinase/integrase n=1 Tax=Demequina lignilytica TaxID=3051663 RepID=UPI002615B24D|nr:site-specific integrase [Demequina sp. SYSU T00068]MDN4489240.1 site-specific integrase [Demequina sp. SYSU T00068]
MQRSWIEDRWKDKNGRPTSSHGEGSRWQAYWLEPDEGSGRFTVRRRKRFRTKSEAERFLASVEHAHRTHTYVSPEKPETPFGEAAQGWLDAQLQLKDSTRYRYTRDLTTYVLPRWSTSPLRAMNTRAVQDWVRDLARGAAPVAYSSRTNGLNPGDQHSTMRGPLSPNSIKHLVHIVSAVLAWAVDTGLLGVSPVGRVRLPRPQKMGHVYLDHADVDTLADSAYGVTARECDRILIYLLAYTGLRINEALALRVGDLSLARGRLVVRETWSAGLDGKPRLGTPKTHKQRQVGIPAFVVDMLRELTAHMDADEFVFQGPRGGPLNAHNWRTRVFNLARADANIDERLTPHGLRHTAASLAISTGADVMLIQHMLGHAHATETLNTYAHLWPDRIDTLSSVLDTHRRTATHGPTTFSAPLQGPVQVDPPVPL